MKRHRRKERDSDKVALLLCGIAKRSMLSCDYAFLCQKMELIFAKKVLDWNGERFLRICNYGQGAIHDED